MSEIVRPESPGPTATCAPGPAQHDSDDLFAGQRELIIVHRGEAYRLRITRQEKLILTK